jgi:hypothetical protein
VETADVELHPLLVPHLIELLFGQHAHRDLSIATCIAVVNTLSAFV